MNDMEESDTCFCNDVIIKENIKTIISNYINERKLLYSNEINITDDIDNTLFTNYQDLTTKIGNLREKCNKSITNILINTKSTNFINILKNSTIDHFNSFTSNKSITVIYIQNEYIDCLNVVVKNYITNYKYDEIQFKDILLDISNEYFDYLTYMLCDSLFCDNHPY